MKIKSDLTVEKHIQTHSPHKHSQKISMQKKNPKKTNLKHFAVQYMPKKIYPQKTKKKTTVTYRYERAYTSMIQMFFLGSPTQCVRRNKAENVVWNWCAMWRSRSLRVFRSHSVCIYGVHIIFLSLVRHAFYYRSTSIAHNFSIRTLHLLLSSWTVVHFNFRGDIIHISIGTQFLSISIYTTASDLEYCLYFSSLVWAFKICSLNVKAFLFIYLFNSYHQKNFSFVFFLQVSWFKRKYFKIQHFVIDVWL